MKKIFISLLAVAALAACTKSEVQYEPAGEIGFAPAVKNITKAAMPAGGLDESQKINVWAYWDQDGAVETQVASYTAYATTFLDEATFAQKTVNGTTAWGGDGVAYPWPVNGALVFSGYTTPTAAETAANGYDVSYTLGSDKMVFTNYTQSSNTASTFDLCWFNHTVGSHNNRTSGQTVDVTLSHALTWITIKAYGDGTPVATGSEWQIKSITLKDVVTVGTGTCVGAGADKASWVPGAKKSDITVFNTPTNIPSTAAVFETNTNGTVVIPQAPVQMEVVFDYPVGVNRVEEKVTVNLTLADTKDKDGYANTAIDTWQSGTHYTYTLFFKGNEILVAPSYGAWTEKDHTVTVE